MRPESQNKDQLELDSHAVPPNNVYSEPWWRNGGYNPVSLPLPVANASNSSSLECPNDASESNEDQSLSDEDDDDIAKDSHSGASPRPGILQCLFLLSLYQFSQPGCSGA